MMLAKFHSNCARLVCVAALLIGSVGCSGSKPMTGGTPGTLHLGADPLREVQIHVHRTDDGQAVGFGVTTEGGAFELFQPGAAGPLHLEPGEYAFTLESLGPETIALPRDVQNPRRTPLRKSWTASDTRLDLVIPKGGR